MSRPRKDLKKNSLNLAKVKALLRRKGDPMETIYECILGNITHFAQTEQEAMEWLDANPTGKYRNTLHCFVINGKERLIVPAVKR